ncbi:hypothetical protein LRAMOSA06174 [Lichtheimia ramosa]|uniref:NADH dehydrogenase [ubiquinone] iron-sulfur protein 4, mitochondrial n=1 Tax=Lichtheimia ramosa TaxID=688394 RepID=A0A077X417_9FUNG|nr:hypothetical protein LRAMOSA06174 [Lichtheimia ramosa]
MFIPRTKYSIFRPAIQANVIAHRWTTTQVTRPQIEHRPTSVEPASGAPEELTTERSVRIFSPCKSASQQGVHNTRHWCIDFDIIPDAEHFENPLIGWVSSADYQQGLQMTFDTKEAAINFAERQGWDYYVHEPAPKKFVKKEYADNFKYSPGPLRLILTK